MRSDLPDVIIDILNAELQSSYVVGEWNRRIPTERDKFVMAFSCYLLWLIKKYLESKISPEQIAALIKNVHNMIRQCSWYQSGLFENIWEAEREILPMMRSGKHTGILLPFVHVIEAANLAGCQLSHSNDAEFEIYVTVLMKSIEEQISSIL